MMQALKPHAQRLLKRAGLYERLKASPVYDWYWSVADKRILAARAAELAFYRDLLGGLRRGDLIFDIGANEGHKTDIFLRLGATVVAVDPDEHCQRTLRQRFHDRRLIGKPVVVVGKAMSDRETVESMWMDTPGSAKNTLSGKWVEALRRDQARFGHTLEFAHRQRVETITIEHLFKRYGAPWFIKIDVEGYEPRVIRGMQHPVPYLSFEINLPEFISEGLECVEMLQRLAANGSFNYASDCQLGLCLDRWLDAREFSQILAQCSAQSVEVFWKTPLSASH